MKRDFEINVRKVKGENRRFWRAAGSDLLYWLTLRPEGRELLDRMAAQDSALYLRNHYALSSKVLQGVQIGGEVYSEDDEGNPVYDFEKINRVYNEYVKRGLKPVVECDYIPDALIERDESGEVKNPGPQAPNNGPRDWDKWYDLIKAFTRNLVDTFGLEEVRTWYFEVWNEPDGWPMEEFETFFKLYDNFVHAVTSVDHELKVGGPACHHNHKGFLRCFLHHIAKGTNHVTGEKGTRIDFISYHIYGISGAWLKSYPLVQPTVQWFIQQFLWLQRVINDYPELKNAEFHLNEWGVSSSWRRTVHQHPALEIRNSEYSALFLTKLVDSIFALEDEYEFIVSMLLYWGFAEEAAGEELFMGQRSLTTAGNIPKPVQTAHEMLSKMGGERIEVAGARPGDNTGLFATRKSETQLEFMAYNFNELASEPYPGQELNVDITGLGDAESLRIQVYCLDRNHHNTYRHWEKQGAPGTLQEADMEILREIGNLKPDFEETVSVEEGSAALYFVLPMHSMRLYEITIVP